MIGGNSQRIKIIQSIFSNIYLTKILEGKYITVSDCA